jgi:hypothetical protein
MASRCRRSSRHSALFEEWLRHGAAIAELRTGSRAFAKKEMAHAELTPFEPFIEIIKKRLIDAAARTPYRKTARPEARTNGVERESNERSSRTSRRYGSPDHRAPFLVFFAASGSAIDRRARSARSRSRASSARSSASVGRYIW